MWGRGHKYRAQRTEVDGISFASKAEAKRYSELKLLSRGKVITDLQLQPRYTLEHNGVKITEYRADFAYSERDAAGRIVSIVEDVKGTKTDVYLIKKKLMLALLGIEIREVHRGKVVDPNAPKRRRRRRTKKAFDAAKADIY